MTTRPRFVTGARAFLIAATLTLVSFSAASAANLFVVQSGANDVRMLSGASADLGIYASGGLDFPTGITFDASGRAYVASYSNSGVFRAEAGGGSLGLFAAAGLDNPMGLAFDAVGNLYVANYSGQTVRRFSPTGADLGNFANTGLDNPAGIAFDSVGNLYVANVGNDTIRKFSAAGADLGVFATTGMNNPIALEFDAVGNLYAANSGSNTVRRFSPSGMDLGDFATVAPDAGPSGLAFDENGDLYVSNALSGDIQRFSATGAALGTFASGLNFPYFMEFSSVPVPEPGSGMLATVAVSGVLLVRRRRAIAMEKEPSNDVASPEQLGRCRQGSAIAGRCAVAVLTCLLCMLPQPVRAEVDFLVYQSGGEVRVGAFDFGTSTAIPEQRIFANQLQFAPALPGVARISDPGWNAVSSSTFLPSGASSLPGQVDVGFNIVAHPTIGSNLAFWDGAGPVTFGAPPAGEVMFYSKGLMDFVLADGGANDVPGFTIARTNNSGYIHRHLPFELFGNSALDDASLDTPTSGVYLLSLEATVQGFTQPSSPFFVLFGNGASAEQLGQAEAWLGSSVPEPTSIGLGIVAAIATLAMRRLRG